MIKVLSSTQPGAPELSGTVGSMIALLNKALIEGYGEQSIDTLTSSGTVATASITAGHSLVNGDVIRVSGASPIQYNGTYKIYACTTTNFNYDIVGVAQTTATGTIVCKIAPLDWTAGLAEGFKKVFIPSEGCKRFYRFDETPIDSWIVSSTYVARNCVGVVDIFETMADINIGSPEPHMYKVFFNKSRVEGTTPRPWHIVGTGGQFYLFVSERYFNPDSLLFDMYFFGDFISTSLVDAYNSAIIGRYAVYSNGLPYYNQHTGNNVERSSATSLYGIGNSPLLQDNIGAYILRDYRSVSGLCATRISNGGLGTAADAWNSTVLGDMNMIDGSSYFMPVYILEPNVLRGRLPGLYHSIHKPEIDAATSIRRLDSIDINGISRSLISIMQSSSVIRTLDITGPWE